MSHFVKVKVAQVIKVKVMFDVKVKLILSVGKMTLTLPGRW